MSDATPKDPGPKGAVPSATGAEAPSSETGRPQPSPASLKVSLLGCGCATGVLGLMLVVGGLLFLTYRQSQRLQGGYQEPEAAAEQVADVLPYQELPDGYYPFGGASVPVFFRLAILTDLPPEERPPGQQGPRFERSGFVYFSTFSLRSDDAELLGYFEQGPKPGEEEMEVEIPKDSLAGDLEMDFEPHEVLGRGSTPIRGGRAYYVSRRGRLEVSGDGFAGLATLFYVKCDEGRRVRFGLWFGPEPEAGTAPRYRGTPADPEALSGFLSHFLICS